MKRILVTGSREWTDRNMLNYALNQHCPLSEAFVVVHGDCPSGADRMAKEWAGIFGEAHPADWQVGRHAGHLRNQRMVDLGADLCLAFFHPGAANRGTSDCAKRATKAGIRVFQYPPMVGGGMFSPALLRPARSVPAMRDQDRLAA